MDLKPYLGTWNFSNRPGQSSPCSGFYRNTHITRTRTCSMFQIMFWNMIFWNMCSAMFQNMCSKLCSSTWFFRTCVLACSRTCVLNMILEHNWPCPFKYLDKLVKFLYILCRLLPEHAYEHVLCSKSCSRTWFFRKCVLPKT